MTFILYMRGATAHEGQIGRVWWRVPFQRFGGLGRASVQIAPREG